jgi:hypothetical protein
MLNGTQQVRFAQRVKFLTGIALASLATYAVHAWAAALYYRYCSRSLLSVLLFRRSDVCMGLWFVTRTIERLMDAAVREAVAGLGLAHGGGGGGGGGVGGRGGRGSSAGPSL